MNRIFFLKLTFCLGLIFNCFISNAQGPGWLWQKRGNGYANAITKDNEGNFYSFGNNSKETASIDGSTIPGHDTNGMFIIKSNPGGSIIWARGYSYQQQEFTACDIVPDKYDNIYILGTMKNGIAVFGPDTLVGDGYKGNPFIAKLDKYGDILWARSAGGAGEAEIHHGISIDDWGNAYITGGFYSTIKFGNITLSGHNQSTDVFLAKYDANGNAVWARSYSGPGYDGAYGICADKDGNSYITGYCRDSVYFNSYLTLPKNSSAIFLAKHDKDGNQLWVKTSSGSRSDAGIVVTIDQASDIYVTGKFADTISIGNHILQAAKKNASSNAFLAKYDKDGNELWAKNISRPTSNFDLGLSLTTDKVNNVYAGGDMTGIAFITKYTASGNQLWMKTDTTIPYKSRLTSIRGISIGNDGNAYIAALLDSFGGPQHTFAIGKLGLFPQSVNQLANTAGVLNLYPNPAMESITINSTITFENINITDITGKIVLTQPASKNKTINIHHLPAGVYILQATNEAGTKQAKFIKE